MTLTLYANDEPVPEKLICWCTILLELISLTLVCGLVDPSLFASLLKLLQWGLASIYQGKLESLLIKVSLRITFLSRQSSCVVIVPSQLANHA